MHSAHYVGGGAFWGEVATVPLLENEFMPYKVKFAHFDNTHELLWSATEGGHVYCHSIPTLQLVSSIGTIQDEIRDTAVMPEGRLLIAGSRAFKLQSWGGLGVYEHHIEQSIELVSCSQAATQGSSVVFATCDGDLLLWDFAQKRCLRTSKVAAGLTHVRRNATSALLAVATVDGKVGLVDSRSSAALSGQVAAHLGGVNEMSFAGNSLATCGFRQSTGYHSAMYDSVVRVFDVRQTIRPVSQVPFTSTVLSVALHPRLHGTLMISSPNAVFSMADIGTGSLQQLYEVPTEGHLLGASCLSSTGSCIAFASDGGTLHLWSNTPSPLANAHSVPVDVPLTRIPQHATPLTENSSFNVPSFYKLLSQATAPLASDHDHICALEVGMPPRVLELPILKQAYSQPDGSVHHARNPNYVKGMGPGANAAAVAALRNNRAKQQEGVADADAAAAERKAERRRARGKAGGVLLPTAYQYRMIPVRKKQKAFLDLDYAAQMTNTIFSGLENLVPNSYCNALLQVFYFQPVFRAQVLAHKPNPEHEMSLMDDLRFLFQMLLQSNRVPCQASNLLRLLKRLPEAASVGLLEAQDVQSLNPALDTRLHISHERSLARRVVKLSRFCLDMLHKEACEASDGVSPTSKERPTSGGSQPGSTTWVEELFGMHMLQHLQCIKLPDSKMRQSRSMQLDLQYPSQQPATRLSFADVVQRSLVDDKTLKMWFDEKLGYQLVQSKRCPLNLPPILVVNTELHKRANVEFWQDVVDASGAKHPWLPWAISITVDTQAMRVEVQQADAADELAEHVHEARRTGLLSSDYVLTAVVCHIRDEDDAENDKLEDVEGSLVAQVRVLPPYLGSAASVTLPGWALTPVAVDASSHNPEAAEPGAASRGTDAALQQSEAAGPPSALEGLQLPDDLFGARTPSPSQHASQLSVDQEAQDIADDVENMQLATPSQAGTDAWDTGTWVVFNDFTVSECDPEEVRNMYAGQKLPCLLLYSQVEHVEEQSALDGPLQLTDTMTDAEFMALCKSPSLQPPSKRPVDLPFTPLDLQRSVPGPNLLLALDAEFVALTAAQKKLVEGREIEVKPMAMCLARVSVVVGSGPQAGMTCIDDRICMVDSVFDYLTKFSGLRPGDLQPATSKYYLTTLKKAYMKLRYLVDKGCVFIGHGLRQDFRMINLTVPPSQMIDTVELFRLKRKRMLSLRYLASYLLKQQIQVSTHDSMEDAYAALHLYKKYLELQESGQLEATLHELYDFGIKHNFKPAVWRDGQPFPLESPPT